MEKEITATETRAFRNALLFILCRLCYIIWNITEKKQEAVHSHCILAEESRENYLKTSYLNKPVI